LHRHCRHRNDLRDVLQGVVHKKLQEESGATIVLRGQGTGSAEEVEPHVLVLADTDDQASGGATQRRCALVCSSSPTVTPLCIPLCATTVATMLQLATAKALVCGIIEDNLKNNATTGVCLSLSVVNASTSWLACGCPPRCPLSALPRLLCVADMPAAPAVPSSAAIDGSSSVGGAAGTMTVRKKRARSCASMLILKSQLTPLHFPLGRIAVGAGIE